MDTIKSVRQDMTKDYIDAIEAHARALTANTEALRNMTLPPILVFMDIS